jgi:adenylate cyclase
MPQEGFKRKLTAILSADAVEYSRLMAEGEEATVRTITAYREVLTTLIQQHNGKVLDSPGDNLLAEFVSVVDAVQCAVALQKEIKSRNDELPENRRMQFRIGINLGDVIQEEERIYGDGVNIAARLEGLAEPGGICISKTAFDHIESKLPSGVAAAVVLAVAVGIWQFYPQSPKVDSRSVEKAASSLPEQPSIAVLPFANMSNDSEQEYFCDGIADQIINSISKIPYITVIARNSSFAYKGKSVNVQQIAGDLGVRYILEGSLQRDTENVRINTQLIDAKTGRHLWAENYDRKLDDIFLVQDEICKSIMVALQVKLTMGEMARMPADTVNIKAYEKYLKALEHYQRRTKEDALVARQLSQEAIALDPEYAAAYLLVGWTYLDDIWLGMTKTPSESIARAEEMVQKAISRYKKALQLDPVRPVAYLNGLAFAYLFSKQYEKAISTWNETLERNPDYLHAYMGLTMAYWFTGSEDQCDRRPSRCSELIPNSQWVTWKNDPPLKIKRLRSNFLMPCERQV